MSFNIGKQKKITEYMEELGYKFTEKELLKNKKIIVQRFEKRIDENGDFYGVLAGQILEDDETGGKKVCFYLPTYDESGLCKCNDEDIAELEKGGYYYFIEKKSSENGRNYFIGYLEVL